MITPRGSSTSASLPATGGGHTEVLAIAGAANRSNSRNMAIDLLRATMVIYIIGFWHLLSYVGSGIAHINWFTDAMTNVVLGTFVFVSGYLLGNWRDSFDLRGSLRFLVRRGLRVYPLYFAALTAFALTGLVDQVTFVKGALLIAMLVPDPPMTLWFITMIMVFYLMVPLMARATRSSLVTHFVLTFSLVLCFDATVNHVDVRIFMYYPAFVLGMFLRRNSAILDFSRARPAVLSLLFGMAIFASSIKTGARLVDAFLFIPAIVSGSLLAFVVAEHSSSLDGRIAAGISVLSYASFCAYLFHRIVFLVAIKMYWPFHQEWQIAYLLFVALPICILLSWLIQTVYDRIIRTLVGEPAPLS